LLDFSLVLKHPETRFQRPSICEAILCVVPIAEFRAPPINPISRGFFLMFNPRCFAEFWLSK
jgi:hypothetical protein